MHPSMSVCCKGCFSRCFLHLNGLEIQWRTFQVSVSLLLGPRCTLVPPNGAHRSKRLGATPLGNMVSLDISFEATNASKSKAWPKPHGRAIGVDDSVMDALLSIHRSGWRLSSEVKVGRMAGLREGREIARQVCRKRIKGAGCLRKAGRVLKTCGH
jgi:hypothetical protein